MDAGFHVVGLVDVLDEGFGPRSALVFSGDKRSEKFLMRARKPSPLKYEVRGFDKVGVKIKKLNFNFSI